MNGCISRNLEWKWSRLTPHSWQCLPCLVVCAYARNRNMKMASSSENGLESARCCALILMLTSVSCTQIYLWSLYDARLMYARMIDLAGFDMRCDFTGNPCDRATRNITIKDSFTPLIYSIAYYFNLPKYESLPLSKFPYNGKKCSRYLLGGGGVSPIDLKKSSSAILNVWSRSSCFGSNTRWHLKESASEMIIPD